MVDQIIGTQPDCGEIAVEASRRRPVLFGATILADGTVALILDVPQLVSFGQPFEERLRGRSVA